MLGVRLSLVLHLHLKLLFVDDLIWVFLWADLWHPSTVRALVLTRVDCLRLWWLDNLTPEYPFRQYLLLFKLIKALIDTLDFLHAPLPLRQLHFLDPLFWVGTRFANWLLCIIDRCLWSKHIVAGLLRQGVLLVHVPTRPIWVGTLFVQLGANGAIATLSWEDGSRGIGIGSHSVWLEAAFE